MRPERGLGGALGALALLFGTVLSTDVAAERWYRVEIVVFAYPAFFETLGDDAPFVQVPALYDVVELNVPDAEDDAEEDGAPGAGAGESVADAETPQADRLDDDGSEAAGDDTEGPPEPPFPAFTVLPEQILELGPIRDRLDAAGEYEPVLHTAWIQPGFGTAARKVRISDRPSDPAAQDVPAEPELLPTSEDLREFKADGFARLRVGRTLNLDLDLYYQTDAAAIRLSESRRVRFRELHYFDHPGFGAIVKVLPVDFGTTGDGASGGDGV